MPLILRFLSDDGQQFLGAGGANEQMAFPVFALACLGRFFHIDEDYCHRVESFDAVGAHDVNFVLNELFAADLVPCESLVLDVLDAGFCFAVHGDNENFGGLDVVLSLKFVVAVDEQLLFFRDVLVAVFLDGVTLRGIVVALQADIGVFVNPL